jgi:hypothetical protein
MSFEKVLEQTEELYLRRHALENMLHYEPPALVFWSRG